MRHDLQSYTRQDLGKAYCSAIAQGNKQRATAVRLEILRRIGETI